MNNSRRKIHGTTGAGHCVVTEHDWHESSAGAPYYTVSLCSGSGITHTVVCVTKDKERAIGCWKRMKEARSRKTNCVNRDEKG